MIDVGEITGSMPELSEFPINDEELVGPVYQWRLSPSSFRNQNAGVEDNCQGNVQREATGEDSNNLLP
jgi:hypothetical protein